MPIDGPVIIYFTGKQSVLFFAMIQETFQAARKQSRLRLANFHGRLACKLPIKVFIASIGKLYTVDFTKHLYLVGYMAFIRLEGGEVVLCKLTLSHIDADKRRVVEIPIAFSRVPKRILEIRDAQILGYLIPCLEK